MFGIPVKRGFLWLLFGLLSLLLSLIFYLVDLGRSDSRIHASVQTNIQADFDACIAYHNGDVVIRPGEDIALACELGFDQSGQLTSWTNASYLPDLELINRLNTLPIDEILVVDNRAYYQVRRTFMDSTHVVLIPLHITYPVSNDFLIPYVFLGRYSATFHRHGNSYIKEMSVAVNQPDAVGEVVIRDREGQIILSLNQVSVAPFRAGWRLGVLICLILGAIFLGIYLRIYSLEHWHYRYFINLSLFIGVIVLRGLMYAVGLPGDYWDAELFSPFIMAFDNFFAPNLGEFSINVLTLGFLTWILYMHLFRITNLWYRRILKKQFLAWPAMMLTIFLSSVLLWLFVKLFVTIVFNSQVDIEFSNIFKANVYSYLILLDIGILLLVATLLLFLLLKLNVLYGRRFGFTPSFLAVQVLAVLVSNLFLHRDESWGPDIALTLSVGLLIIAGALVRIPFRPILHHDLVNYLLLVLVFSVVVTHNVVIGIGFNQEFKAQQISQRMLGNQVVNTITNFTKATVAMQETEQYLRIQTAWQERSNTLAFRNWIRDTYLQPRFKEFEIRLFMYDPEGDRIDRDRDFEPSFPPQADIPLHDVGDSISHNLYQLPNPESRYIDFYIGTFELSLEGDTARKTNFLMELLPSPRETEGLYPSLTLDEEIYDEVKLINSADHAIYRDGFLTYKSGNTSFPVYLANFDRFTDLKVEIDAYDEYYDYREAVGGNKLVWVRFQNMEFLDVITTFSFIFYFYVLASLLIIGLPVLVLRYLRLRKIPRNVPLRAKIRFGLLAISILPMVVIILLLSPFITDRYNDQAKEELNKDAERIASVLDQQYLNIFSDPFGRITSLMRFKEKVEDLTGVIENDINVYDAGGRRLASTRPYIFEKGISPNLMNGQAFEELRQGKQSDLVVVEQVGQQEYFSAYRPIIGNSYIPVGYINIPYLAKQDQLNDQILNLLAYLANIYLLVFLLINVVAVLVSSTITKPLSLIQQRLSSIGLGTVNEPIKYHAKDEIGAIVNAYNQMVDQLSDSEEQLKQNQRELAWRQMARQVAHEIKNPLTPMKLKIQHLSRAWREDRDRFEKMFPQVMKTLLSQIDSMVRIARSFSEFAKMPEPVNTRVQVNEVLLEVVDLFSQSEEAIWLIDIPQQEFWTVADRDQLARSFTNIIKNALQAIEDNGIVRVSMRILQNQARVEIKDNGMGMEPDVQERVFEPSFSTKSSGMGLGLAIVKRIIENSGGSIEFTSEIGVGTTFVIKLPAAETFSPVATPV